MEHGPLQSVQVTSNGPVREKDPLLSLIVPCYNVAAFLPAFLDSLDEQRFDPELAELLFVSDGSQDESEALITEWMSRTPYQVKLIVQSNQGPSAARNTGLRHATGTWVNFPDPDDQFSPTYFIDVLEELSRARNIDMLTTRLARRRGNGRMAEHPLDYRYTALSGPTEFDLRERPEMIHLHGAMAFMRLDLIRKFDIKFDERLRKGFEDAHFVTVYLLCLDAPKYLLVPDAVYYYLAHEASITAQRDYSKYIDIIRLAYFDIMQRAGRECPNWIASLLLYDLWWLFSEHMKMQSAVHGIPPSQQKELDALARQTLTYVTIDQIRSFRIANLPLDVRSSWEAACTPNGESSIPVLRAYDRVRRLQKVAFHHSSHAVKAHAEIDGSQREIAFHKVREILFFDIPWMYEHIYWVDVVGAEDDIDKISLVSESPELNLSFDGKAHDARTTGRLIGKVRYARPQPPKPPRSLESMRRHLRWRWRKFSTKASYAIPYRFGRIIGWRDQFSRAWVMIDRDFQANDNAEALYRYLRNERSDLNPWFVVNKDSPDYRRLKRDGFRVVAHGTKKHFCLMKEAQVLASSMVDHYILYPFPRTYLPKTWTYSFLQHGVTHNRVHRWLNMKDIDQLVTATQPEYDSIVKDCSPYELSQREVELTGMPRHDRLSRLLEKKAGTTTTRVVLMPTWRNYLFGPAKGGVRQRIEGFFESRFVVEWSALFHGKTMTELCNDSQTEVILLPHPGIDLHWQDLVIPHGMKRASYATDDVQEILAGASLVVTDYSSQAFEGAFCGAPTVYFQFDREEFYAGGHIASEGYFDHRRDGFGPVCEDLPALDEQLPKMLDGSHPRLMEYRERIRNLYPARDGHASERVVAAIEKRLHPYR